MTEYRLSPAAQADLDGLFDYTVQQWGLEQALRYAQAIADACNRLALAPMQSQDCAHVRAGYRCLPVGRHVLYFRVEGGGIAIIRILHARMDAPRHLSPP